jgi:hypothetical protein
MAVLTSLFIFVMHWNVRKEVLLMGHHNKIKDELVALAANAFNHISTLVTLLSRMQWKHHPLTQSSTLHVIPRKQIGATF